MKVGVGGDAPGHVRTVCTPPIADMRYSEPPDVIFSRTRKVNDSG